MAITKSAKRALRGSARKRVVNLRVKRTMTAAVKAARSQKGSLAAAYQAIDKAVKSGIIKANAAARTKSRLTRFLKKP